MSKLLSAQEIRWSTIEKEAYAIVYALKKFEYLLRDRKFLLKTDHKNLIYIDKELNAKVKRWKIMIQEYEFDIGYIEGPKNFVADAMSRLIEVEDEQVSLLSEFDLTVDVYNTIADVHNEVCGH